jgi:hypothetical protein
LDSAVLRVRTERRYVCDGGRSRSLLLWFGWSRPRRCGSRQWNIFHDFDLQQIEIVILLLK